MSAIWGCIDLSGDALPEGLCAAMEAPLHEYKIDRYASYAKGNVVMGCGVQYIHVESPREPLPVCDEDAGIYFTADCIVDNREELIPELCPGRTDIPDGELFYLAYKKWQDDVPKHVIGSYSYAVYERTQDRLIIGADHTFSRSIYFNRVGDIVYWGTIIESVIQGRDEPAKVNDEWITIFLSLTSLSILANPIDTPYAGISRVQASHYVVFDKSGNMPVEYWSVKNIRPLKLGSDEEYRQRFRNLMDKVAGEAARTSGNVGILLSSGFDSASVAVVTAQHLEKAGKRLYSYTYVPVEGYKAQYNPKLVPRSEQEGVEAICRMHPVIEPKYLPVPDKNAVSQTREILKTLEIPYKSHTNLAWIDAFTELAAEEDGCRVMLTGQMGNATISAGGMINYILSRICHFRFIDAARAASNYARLMKFGRKRYTKYILENLVPVLVPVFVQRMMARDYLEGSYVNRDVAKTIGLKKRDRRIEGNVGFFKLDTFEMERTLYFNPTAMAHITDAETKMQLKHGMIPRDITKDIRVFEFCLSVPMECLINSKGQTRRLVRHYLSDLLPSDMLSENAPRGMQSVDWRDRLVDNWEAHYAELARGCRQPLLERYINRDMVEKTLEKFKTCPQIEDRAEFMKLCAVYTVGIFLAERMGASPF